MTRFIHKLALLMPPLGKISGALKICAAYLRSIEQKRKLSGSSGKPIIIYALPKSGSTWLESMLSSINEYDPYMPWQASIDEFIHGSSDDFELKLNYVKALRQKNAVIKIHSRPNNEVLRTNHTLNLPYIVLTRNINDTLESHVHYARKTKYHPDYSQYNGKSLSQCIDIAHGQYLTRWSDWVDDWNNIKDSNKLMVNYDSLLNGTEAELTRIMSHLNIRVRKTELASIIEENSLENMKKNAVQKSFFRGSKLN